MIEFHDYDPAHPFDVFGEKHIIQGSKITLDYVPLQSSVTIEGFTENTTGTPGRGEFYIEYGAEDNYRTADQIVHFPEGYEGYLVTVDYKGVSTILRAKHMNEIKRFMEYGASELAARMIVLHEQQMQEQMKEWRDNLLAEVRGIKETLAEAFTKGAEGGGCPFCPCRRKDIFPDETMDSGDVEEERQGEPVQYDGGDITDESTDHPSYANDAGEIISEGGKEPTAPASDVSESDTSREVVENSVCTNAKGNRQAGIYRGRVSGSHTDLRPHRTYPFLCRRTLKDFPAPLDGVTSRPAGLFSVLYYINHKKREKTLL